MFKTAKYLMFQEEKIRKDKLVLSTRDMVVPTKDGRLSILTKLLMSQLKDLTKNSVCTSVDHSTLYPDFQ
jgi:hypothetical protein